MCDLNDFNGFLHRHPAKERNIKLEAGHVIVDYEDWKTARKYYYQSSGIETPLSIADDLEKRAFTGNVHGELKPLHQEEIREFIQRIRALK